MAKHKKTIKVLRKQAASVSQIITKFATINNSKSNAKY